LAKVKDGASGGASDSRMDGEDQDHQGVVRGHPLDIDRAEPSTPNLGIKHTPFDTPEPASFHGWRPTTRG
jgi:hypothetical protein